MSNTMKIAQAMAENALFLGIYEQFNALKSTQKIALFTALIVGVGILLFFKVIAPLYESRTAAQQRLPQLEAAYALMQSQAAEIETLRKNAAAPPAAPSASQAPPSVVLPPTQLTPQPVFSTVAVSAQFGAAAVVTKTSDTTISVAHADTTIAQFINNITALKAAHGVLMSDFTVTPSATLGFVNVSATLLKSAGK